MEEGKQFRLSFSSVCGKKVEADFDGGVVTSDSGVLLAREVDRKIGVIDCLVSAL
ncbi:MAG: IS1380 family transposase, partial [Candidatus Latescibacteria bacterium]|nr:IS1380 family transposase [Candidatus Latescibacterota bacterium]